MKTYTFGIRDTPRGAVAWMVAPSGRRQEKRFRNSYSSGRTKAGLWIDHEVSVIHEAVALFEMPEMPEIIRRDRH